MRRLAHGCADHFGGSHERISFAYEMRLGETEPGTAPGTFNRSIYVPAFSSGVWLRMSTLDGTFTRDVRQVAITDTVESSSDACTVEVYERDERGRLQGVVLHVIGLDEAGYFETDARELRRNREGGWDGETAGRSVKLWGYLTPEGEK